MAKQSTLKLQAQSQSGKLRIGDHWNAITIIALSQSNPLKAIAEFVENSIDAKAKNITIIRGKERGFFYLKITDDGEGIPRDETGLPNFKYVATHICDSLKRQLKHHGATGMQGEFGIGLLSFWTVGQEMTLTSSGADGRCYQMRMSKGDPSYTVHPKRLLFAQAGTELVVSDLLPGVKQLSGDKLQWYLASELRDRIKHTGVKIKIIDRLSHKEHRVEPRKFEGQLVHGLPTIDCPLGNIYVEIYLSEPNPNHHIGLYRSGTRVLEQINDLEPFQKEPWTAGYFQGLIDVSFLNLTPGTRLGIIQDEVYALFCTVLKPVEAALAELLAEQRKAEEEKTSRDTLRSIQKAFQEALMVLPEEEYDWFELRKKSGYNSDGAVTEGLSISPKTLEESAPSQKQFFDFPGPLFSVRLSPASCVVAVKETRHLRAVPRDRHRRLVEDNLSFSWEILEGGGSLHTTNTEVCTFEASAEPALVRVQVTVTQGQVKCVGEALITVTDELIPPVKGPESTQQGLPGYTFQKEPGQNWRSRFLAEQNVIVINNAHRDFVYASRNKALKLKYICRLFSKELILKNFPGLPADQLLERMIELALHTEENLK
ncbi:MAG: ATP-binding protein [Deltaproteobacteria bacterium]|nr:ATP-binding protein [Deltaproteobacteria bacterium]